jgi:hypothetical protein
MSGILFSNPKHVYVRWFSSLDIEREDPEELGGILHRFDYQTEANNRFYTIAYKNHSFATGADDNIWTDIGLQFMDETEWYAWLKQYHMQMINDHIVDSDTGEVYAVFTISCMETMIRDLQTEITQNDVDMADVHQSLGWLADMLEQMQLG